MRKFALAAAAAISLTIASGVYAYGGNRQAHNLITFPVTSQMWLKTKSAKVQVGINANINSKDLGKLHNDIDAKLQKIAKSDWHITQFNRSQDNSGLEKVYAQAQTRLPVSALSNLRDKAKAISHPGTTYKINSVQFTPSEQQLEHAKFKLRFNIYHRIKQELDQLNKVYAGRDYRVYSINFLPMQALPSPQAKAMFVRAEGAGNSMVVSNKLKVNAVVTLRPKPMPHPRPEAKR